MNSRMSPGSRGGATPEGRLQSPITVWLEKNQTWEELIHATQFEIETELKRLAGTVYRGLWAPPFAHTGTPAGSFSAAFTDVLLICPLTLRQRGDARPHLQEEAEKRVSALSGPGGRLAILFLLCLEKRDLTGNHLADVQWASQLAALGAQPLPLGASLCGYQPSRTDLFALHVQCRMLLRELDNLLELDLLRSRIEDLETQVEQLWGRVK